MRSSCHPMWIVLLALFLIDPCDLICLSTLPLHISSTYKSFTLTGCILVINNNELIIVYNVCCETKAPITFFFTFFSPLLKSHAFQICIIIFTYQAIT